MSRDQHLSSRGHNKLIMGLYQGQHSRIGQYWLIFPNGSESGDVGSSSGPIFHDGPIKNNIGPISFGWPIASKVWSISGDVGSLLGQISQDWPILGQYQLKWIFRQIKGIIVWTVTLLFLHI